MSPGRRLSNCSEVAPLLVFYACDEVDSREREQIAAHLGWCEQCALQLREEQEMHTALMDAFQPADQIDPSGALLAQCRSELSELLDDLSAPPLREQWSPFGWVRRWMALRPVWSAAGLVAVGLLVGTQVTGWLPGHDAGTGSAVNVKPVSILSGDLSNITVAGINFPSGGDASSGTVQLQVRAEQPMVISGSVDDADVRRVLTYVVANGERFDPGVRLDCLDVLKARTSDKEVRHALLTAARADKNPAVRMKALEALRDSAGDESVRDALLDALHHDANPGVRVEAVNLLVNSLGEQTPEAPAIGEAVPEEPRQIPDVDSQIPVDPSVARVIRALEELQRGDPNRYVRLRSAAALRQISPRDVQ